MFFYYGLISLFFIGCGSEKGEGSEDGTIVDQEWWDELEEETSGTSDESKDEDKEDYGEYGDCGAEFDSTQPCEGSWEDTICLQDDLIWWCQDGVWLNEEDKEN